MELIYKGSVKDLYSNNDTMTFKYSDRYSIFDWGQMPDEIPYKGEALASLAASFFKYLEQKNIHSHFKKQIGKNEISVQPVKVLRPEWIEGQYDYSIYVDRPQNTLVPLEVIFRRYLGQGNSLEKRLQKNPEYLKDLDLSAMPTSSTHFEPALVEFSTKLESSDRYLSKRELSEMNIANELEIKNLKTLTQEVTTHLRDLFAKLSIKLWDGKFEYGFGVEKNGARELFLVDSIGPDELRLTYEGLPLSKEFLRQIYLHTPWAQGVQKAKGLAQERKTQDWKKICVEELNLSPQSLSPRQLEVSSLLYQALANEVALAVGSEPPFERRADLKTWAQEAKNLLEESEKK